MTSPHSINLCKATKTKQIQTDPNSTFVEFVECSKMVHQAMRQNNKNAPKEGSGGGV
jgi:hypothetical protein